MFIVTCCNYYFYFHLDSDENYTLFVQYLKSDQISAEEFDLYWRKCAPYRFKQISESKTTAEIFSEWPDYIKPSGFHLVSILNNFIFRYIYNVTFFQIDIDFSLKFPMAKNIHERWSQYSNKVLTVLKTKICNVQISKMLHEIKSKSEGNILLFIILINF